MLFFFFKQKTAYERRISDWGSDVCSSDLNTDPMRVEERRVQHRRCAAMFQIPMAAASRQVNVRPTSKVRRATLDRKSVVSGKSVSVRVDLGGRRLITKNNPHIPPITHIDLLTLIHSTSSPQPNPPH